MGVQNSPVEEFILGLLTRMLADIATQYPESKKSLDLDLRTLQKRVEKEGLSFLAIALPKLGKALDRGLESGSLREVDGFNKKKPNRILPILFSSLWERIFDEFGVLTTSPDVSAIKYVRQLTFLYYKYEAQYPDAAVKKVLDNFVRIEEVHLAQEITTSPVILNRARDLLARVLGDLDFHRVLPRHGRGSVATGEKGECKWEFSRLYKTIHQVFPYYSYFCTGSTLELLDRVSWYRGLERLESGCAKVILVPKDSRGPRIISCEPLEYQYIQQGIMRVLYPHIESHPLTAGHVNFTDQTVNRELAREASLSGYFATVDLKDASDCVSVKLVERIFPSEVLRVLMATRSTHTALPNGEVIALKKFAPMGSALCFPVEALTFWALAVAAIQGREGESALSDVYVYGDDLIVPCVHLERVRSVLESSLLVVNDDKTLSQGSFRESCGLDAYLGIDVTPTRLKAPWCPRPGDSRTFVSYVDVANNLENKGYYQSAEYIYSEIEKTYGMLPYAVDRSQFPCRLASTFLEAYRLNKRRGFKIRWVRGVQQYQIRTLVPRSGTSESKLDGWTRLLRNLVHGVGDNPSQVVLPRSTKISKRFARFLT